MKIVSNEKMIQRNKKIGQYTTLGSLGILLVGLYFSFQPDKMTYSWLALLLGFMLSQVGVFFGSRYGRSPRPDEKISAALKGLDDRYTLYHYKTFTQHLLVGPSGFMTLLPYNQVGTITYDDSKHRWKQKGGNLYLKIFAQEGLGRPDLEAASTIEDGRKFLEKNLELASKPEVRAVLVFTNEKAVVNAQNAHIPTMSVDKLKDFVRKVAKESPMPDEQFRSIQKLLPEE